MAASTPISSREAQFFAGLRTRYEQQGFDFQMPAPIYDLPGFLGSYTPDAIAQKPGLNVAIEVKNQDTSVAQDSLQQIRKLFHGRSDWRFDVVFMGADQAPRISIPPVSPKMLRMRIDEVQTMASQGQYRAAFVMAWSLLEAALHVKSPEVTDRPRGPRTVLQALAMNGYIEPQLEQRMRSLIALRDRIVHGDVDSEPTSADVHLVLSAIAETLEADAA